MFLGNCLEPQSMWRFIELVGFIGGGLTVVMLAMRTMIPLRVVGIASNIFQIAFGVLAGVTPMWIQHGVLLPVNVYRLFEQMHLVKQVREASAVDLSMDWLIPYMTKRRVEAGRTLFHKGQAADEMFIVFSGRLRLSESALDVLPGSVVGELGLLAPNQQRTQTLECVENSEIMQIGYDRIKSVYFQNPTFGFYFLRLTSARLFQNIRNLEAALEERDREIQRQKETIRRLPSSPSRHGSIPTI